jgi:hypothetical protein
VLYSNVASASVWHVCSARKEKIRAALFMASVRISTEKRRRVRALRPVQKSRTLADSVVIVSQ